MGWVKGHGVGFIDGVAFGHGGVGMGDKVGLDDGVRDSDRSGVG